MEWTEKQRAARREDAARARLPQARGEARDEALAVVMETLRRARFEPLSNRDYDRAMRAARCL